MCVIMVVEDKDPTFRVVRECWDSNAFGAGIAWRENGVVRWDKGSFYSPDEVFESIRGLPKPYVVHFRIPTVGDTVEELCHPFPLGGGLALRGATKDGVIAHNGHWSDWQDCMLKFLPKRIPAGPWSDSRAMAWIAQEAGTGVLDLIDNLQKIVLFTPTKLIRYGHWTYEKELGIWFSNMHWDTPIGYGDYRGWQWTGSGWKRETAPGVTVYRPADADNTGDTGRPIDADEHENIRSPYLASEYGEIQAAIHKQLGTGADSADDDPWPEFTRRAHEDSRTDDEADTAEATD